MRTLNPASAVIGAFAILAFAGTCLAGTVATGVCPHVGQAVDCGVVFTATDAGLIVQDGPAGNNNPYDGSDDTLIGFINNSSSTLFAVPITGSSNGVGAFAFDGDGPCVFGITSSCGTTSYEGGGVVNFVDFHTFKVSNDSATLIFGMNNTGLPPGATTWFALQGSLTAHDLAPEPSSIALFGFGLVLFTGAFVRKNRTKSRQ